MMSTSTPTSSSWVLRLPLRRGRPSGHFTKTCIGQSSVAPREGHRFPLSSPRCTPPLCLSLSNDGPRSPSTQTALKPLPTLGWRQHGLPMRVTRTQTWQPLYPNQIRHIPCHSPLRFYRPRPRHCVRRICLSLTTQPLPHRTWRFQLLPLPPRVKPSSGLYFPARAPRY